MHPPPQPPAGSAPIPKPFVAPFHAAWERHVPVAMPQDAAVCHPVFFTPRLMRRPLQQQQQQHPRPSPTAMMTSPVAHGYVYHQGAGQQKVVSGTPKL